MEDSGTAPKTPRVNTWDRSWTLDELRGETKTWTLASDAGLLHYLQEFSNRILSRTKDLESQVDALVFETKAADVKVHNTFNEFLQLSNSQFIENRVYDDDESLAPQEGTEKASTQPQLTQEQMEAILVPKYTEAIAFGVEALHTLTLDHAEHEEETEDGEQERPTKKARKESDIYSRHPLPAIIGTKEFNEDEYCGLVVEEEDEDEGVESEPEEEKKEENGKKEDSDEFSSSEDETNKDNKDKSQKEEEETPKESEKDGEKESEDKEKVTVKAPDSLMEELKKKQKGDTSEGTVPQVTEKQEKKPESEKEKSKKDEEMFAAFEDEKDPFASADEFLGIKVTTQKHTLTFEESPVSDLFGEKKRSKNKKWFTCF